MISSGNKFSTVGYEKSRRSRHWLGRGYVGFGMHKIRTLSRRTSCSRKFGTLSAVLACASLTTWTAYHSNNGEAFGLESKPPMMNPKKTKSFSVPLKTLSGTRLVLLDRDGVINVDRGTWVLSAEEFEFVPDVPRTIAQLHRQKKKIAVVTNQSCLGRGMITEDTLETIHAKMQEAIEREGGEINSIHVAPDTPNEASHRRKPGPGMLIEAMQLHQIAPENTVMVGDTINDMLAATRADITAKILLCTGHGRGRGEKLKQKGIQLPVLVAAGSEEEFEVPSEICPVWICEDLPSAADYLLL